MSVNPPDAQGSKGTDQIRWLAVPPPRLGRVVRAKSPFVFRRKSSSTLYCTECICPAVSLNNYATTIYAFASGKCRSGNSAPKSGFSSSSSKRAVAISQIGFDFFPPPFFGSILAGRTRCVLIGRIAGLRWVVDAFLRALIIHHCQRPSHLLFSSSLFFPSPHLSSPTSTSPLSIPRSFPFFGIIVHTHPNLLSCEPPSFTAYKEHPIRGRFRRGIQSHI